MAAALADRGVEMRRVAGWVAEQLTALGYSVVVDGRGDCPIGRTRERVRVAEGRVDHPSAVRSLLRHADGNRRASHRAWIRPPAPGTWSAC
jgi:hypothetical protein